MMKQLGKPGNRKMYNTDTGTKIAYKRGGTGDTYFYEVLYSTPKGDFFIHGKGGSLTKWNGKENILEVSQVVYEHWIKDAVKVGAV